MKIIYLLATLYIRDWEEKLFYQFKNRDCNTRRRK